MHRVRIQTIAFCVFVLSGSAMAQVKIGVAGPITGANAAFGAQLVNGTQQAADDISKAGGILGQQITIEQGVMNRTPFSE